MVIISCETGMYVSIRSRAAKRRSVMLMMLTIIGYDVWSPILYRPTSTRISFLCTKPGPSDHPVLSCRVWFINVNNSISKWYMLQNYCCLRLLWCF